jgi:hypothetical protein
VPPPPLLSLSLFIYIYIYNVFLLLSLLWFSSFFSLLNAEQMLPLDPWIFFITQELEKKKKEAKTYKVGRNLCHFSLTEISNSCHANPFERKGVGAWGQLEILSVYEWH